MGSATGSLSSVTPIGIAGTVLQSGGTSALPAWSASEYPATGNNTGDLLYGSNTDQLSFLPISTTATQYLANTGAGNKPAWNFINLTNGTTGTLPIGSGGTNATTATISNANGTIYFDGTRFVTTAPGTATQVLTSNGPLLPPSYQNVAIGTVTSVNPGTNINITGPATAPIVNVDNNPTFSGLVTASAGITATGTTNINTSGSTPTTIGNGTSSTTIAGPTTLSFLSAPGVLSINNAGLITSTTPTNHAVQVGNASGSISSVTPIGNSGTLLQSTGSSTDPSWTTSTYPSNNAQGDIIFGSAANTFTTLPISTTSTQYLANTGAGNTPQWNFVNLANGTTGTLPIASGGTNTTAFTVPDGTVYFDGTSLSLATTATGAATQVLTSNGPGVPPSYQTISSAGAVTSVNPGTNINITGTATAPVVNVVNNPTFSGLVTANGGLTVTSGATITGTTAINTSGPAGTTIGSTSSATTIAGATTLSALTRGVLQTDNTGVVSANTATQNSVQIGNATGGLTSVNVGANNTVLLGTGNAPSFGQVPNAALANNSITLSNGNNITVSGSPVPLGGTATINVSGTTTHAIQVGNASGSLTSVATGTTGQLLQSQDSTADPRWTTSTYPTTNAQGDVIIGSAANTLTTLPINTSATRYLANTGTGNVPQWDVINLTNGVTGILATTNGGTGSNTSTFTADGTLYFDGTNFATTTTGSGAQVLTSNGPGLPPSYQPISASGGITAINPGSNITVTGSAPVPTVGVVTSPTFAGLITGNAGLTITGTTGITGTTTINISGNTATTLGNTLSTTTIAGPTALSSLTQGVLEVDNTGLISSSPTTQHAVQIGNATGGLANVGIGAINTALLGTGGDPSFGKVPNAALVNSSVTLNNGTNITVSGSPLALGGTATISVSGTTAHAVQVGNTSGGLTSVANGLAGQLLQSQGTLSDPQWTTTTYPTSSNQGDIIYGSAANTLSTLGKNTTATRYLANTGTNNNPNWDQVDLTTGVTNVLPINNGGTGSNAGSFIIDGTLYFNGTNFATTATGSGTQVLTSNGPGLPPTYQSISAAGGVTSVNAGTNINVTGTATAPIINVINNPTFSALVTANNGITATGTTAINSSGSATTTLGNGLSTTTIAGPTTLSSFTQGVLETNNTGQVSASPTTQSAVQIGNASGGLTSVGVGANNTVLLGTGGNPSFEQVPNAALVNSSITLNNGNNITVTGSPVALGGAATVNVSGTTAHAVQLGNTSGSLTSAATGTAGQLLQSQGASTDPQWTSSTYPATNALGDLIYGSATNTLSTLPINTSATRYLANTGSLSNNIPQWDVINLTNGVTGVLPIANGGTNANSFTVPDGTVYFDGTRLVTTATGSGTQVLTSNGPGVAPTYQSISAAGGVTSVNAGTNINITGTATAPIVNVINNPTFSGLVTGNGGLTVIGTTAINTSGSATTSIGGISSATTVGGSLTVNNGETITNGTLALPAGSTASPSLIFTGNSTGTGLSANGDVLSLSTAGSERMRISSTGVAIDNFVTPGVVHNDTSGNLTTSLVVGNDIAVLTIPDSRLQPISTAGKVLNSATTATPSNTPLAIVARDASGNFVANNITASLTGAASLNVLKAGDTMTGNLNMAAQSAVNFYDNSSGNFVGINAPVGVATSYTLSLPSTAPTAHEIMRANATTPTLQEWYLPAASTPPATARVIYVATYGSDVTGDGSQSSPFASLAQAVSVANPLSASVFPLVIAMNPGTYVENNNAGPITISGTDISVVGDSLSSVIIVPTNNAQNLLLTTQTAVFQNLNLAASGSSTAAGVSISGTGNETSFTSVTFSDFQYGVLCGGTSNQNEFNACAFQANTIGININAATVLLANCTILGSITPGAAANTGITATGSGANVFISGSFCVDCQTGITISNNANLTAQSTVFRFNANSIAQTSGNLTVQSCTFNPNTTAPTVTEVQVSGAGTTAIISSSIFDNNVGASGMLTALSVTGQGVAVITDGQIDNYTKALVIGSPTDTASTQLNASALSLINCTQDIVQQGTSTLHFTASSSSSSKISIGNSTNVELAYFDNDSSNTLTIGTDTNNATDLIAAATSATNHPVINYVPSLYATQAIGFTNPAANPSTWFVLANGNADLTAITTSRAQSAAIRLVSDEGSSGVGGTSAIRGWDITKNADTNAGLSFNYQNTDSFGLSPVAQYTVMQIDGVNNQMQFPNAATKIVFDGDTDLYRAAANTLQTDGNLIVGGLTPNRAVATNASSQLVSSVTTATELSNLSGTTSNVQTQLNGKVAKAGDTMTGTLVLPAGTTALPSLTFSGSTTTGLSANSGNLSLSTSGIEHMQINSAGTIIVDAFATPGVVHNLTGGSLSSSLIVNADISATANIANSALATLTQPGLVQNSATTATATNTPNTIVARDTSGNFVASTITANVIGNVTGNLTGNVTGNISGSAASFTGPLVGDVTGTQGATVVSLVGGQTAANVAAATIAANAATSAEVPNTIVKRDASSNFIVNEITINGPVTNPTDAATKAYVDSAVTTGIVPHTPAVAVATSNITTLVGFQTIDGVTFPAGTNRVLLTAQTVSSQNGLWVENAGTWTRPADFASGTEAGVAYVLILEGTINAGSSWLCSTPTAIIDATPTTDPITFVEFSLPSQTTGANVGTGTGSVYQSKSGVTLNFRTLAALAGSHLTIANDADNNEIDFSTDATSNNTPSTLVSRNGSGNFSAGTITAATGLNITSGGATILGNVLLQSQSALELKDSSASANFVGLNAPAAVATSYTLSLPSMLPLSHQVMQANSTTPTNLEWVTPGASVLPATSRIINVATYGSDVTGDGSQTNPYASLAQAVSVANPLSASVFPLVIAMNPGTYVENNNAGPITISGTDISVVGDSLSSVIIVPTNNAQNLLLTTQTAVFQNLNLAASGSSTAAGVSISGTGNETSFTSVTFSDFQYGVLCGGTSNQNEFNACSFQANTIGININAATVLLANCTIFGSITPGAAANTGITATGSGANVFISGSFCVDCQTGITISNNANLTAQSTVFRFNANSIAQTSGNLTVQSCTFNPNTTAPTVTEVQVSGAGTTAIISSSIFDNNVGASGMLTALSVTGQGVAVITDGQIDNYTKALVIGSPTDTASTQLNASALSLINCTQDIVQQGTSTLHFTASSSSSSKISIGNSTNVELAYFDNDSSNTLTIGTDTNNATDLIAAATSATNHPVINYVPSLYATQAIGFTNPAANPSTWFVLANGNADLTAITTSRAQSAAIRLVSDEGSSGVGGTSAIRGWDITKNADTNAGLSFNYQNTDSFGLSPVAQYTVMQIDGVNNQMQFPNAATKIVFDGDTDLYRGAANTLKTDGNLIVGGLSANQAVATNGSSQLISSITTATELSYLSGTTSNVQIQLNGKVAKAGDTMTGTLVLPAGTTALPSLTFTGSTTTGLSANTSNLSFSTSGLERMQINSAGTVIIDGFPIAGVVHNLTGGSLTSSLIVDADITPLTITDDKLSPIVTPGKVANSATTATPVNTPLTIVSRDSSGNFAAGNITANLIGAASLNVLKAGDTMTGNLNMALQSAVDFQDGSGSGRFVGINAPASVPASYTVSLPSTPPTANQYLQANSSSPLLLQWATVGGSPTVTRTYYVAQNGSDSNDGSYSAPFLTVAHAVSVANGVASLTNPVAIFIGSGIFTETVTPIAITADKICLIGSSQTGTVIQPSSSGTLFNISSSNTEFSFLTLSGNSVGTTGVNITSNGPGTSGFISVACKGFTTGFSISSTTGTPTTIFTDLVAGLNGTAITINNSQVAIENSIFAGTPTGPTPLNTGITITGSLALVGIFSSNLTLLNTGVSIGSSANLRMLGSNLGQTTNSIVCSGGCNATINGCTFLTNNASSVNVSASGTNTNVTVNACHFNCEDATNTPRGTALQVTTGATLLPDNSTINAAVLGIQCGTTGDTITTVLRANSVALTNNTTDIQQVGTSTMHFVGGIFNFTKTVIANATNVNFASFNSSTGDTLAIGMNSDVTQPLFWILNGQATPPNLMYESNYYGNKGTLLINPNATPAFTGVQANGNSAYHYIVTSSNNFIAGINLISDTANIGLSDNVRGWTINKTPTVAELAFSYSNNDTTDGQPAIGLNTIVQFNGSVNQIEFPVATTTPLPTNSTAKLLWGTDTDLYRAATATLQTDGSFVAGTGITATTGNIVATAGQVNAGTTMTAGTGLTVTSGGANISGTTNINTTGSSTTTIGNSTGPSVNTIAGTTTINTAGSSTTTIGNASSTTAITGPTNINTTGTATTTIGNSTGNTAVTGNLTVNPTANQIGLTVNGNGTANAATINAGSSTGGGLLIAGGTSSGIPLQVTAASGTGAAATITGNTSAPALLLTGNSTTTAPALRMLNVPAASSGNFLLAIDGLGNVTETTITDIIAGNVIVNGGQTGPLTIGTTNATSLNFITSNNPALSINSAGAVTIGNALTANGGAAITGTTTINTTGSAATSIGSTNAGSTITERVGTSYSLDGLAGSTYTVGASTTTGTITVGGTAQTGTITLGSSSGTNTVAIGAGTGATTVTLANGTGGNTVNIANGAATANNMVNILSGAATGGTQTLNILGAGATRAGAVNIGTGAAAHVINIGNGASTGPVSIGNTTGNTSVTGNLSVVPGTNQTALTINGNGSAPAATINAPGTGSAATMTGNTSAPTLVLTGNNTAAAPALRMTGVPTATASNVLLALDGAGDVTQTTIQNSALILNGGQAGPLTVGTTNGTSLNFITNNNPALLINSAGAVAVNSGLTVTGGETITTGGLTVSAGGAAITGTTTINTAGASATNIGNTSSTTTIAGPTNINITGSAAATQIGSGGTGSVSIGNSTGNTAVAGNLAVTPTTNQTAVTLTGNGSAPTLTITAPGTASATTMTGNASAPTLILTGNGSTTAPALRMLGVPTAATSNFILAIDGSGNVTETTLSNGTFIVNGGQPGPLTIGTTNATSLTLETSGIAALSINSTGNVAITPTSGTGLTVTGGETITGTTNINTSGTATTTIGNSAGPSINALAGTTNINTAGSSTTTIGNASSTTNHVGPTNINITGSAAATQIGTGGTGSVSIGNTTGNTTVAGNLALTPGTNQTALTVTGNGNANTVTITAPGTASAATMTGNTSAPTLVLTGNSTTTAPALRMTGVPTAAGSNVLLALDAAGDVTQTTIQNGSLIVNNGQTGPLVIGTTNNTSLTFETNSVNALAISNTGAVTINTPTSGTGLTINGGGETITAGGLTVSAGGAAITGTTTINTTGAATTTLGNASSTTTITGPANINTTGSAAATQIGSGGTGPVSIGNTTGNTSISGNLAITPGTNQTALTLTGNGNAPTLTINAPGTASATTMTGNTSAPTLVLTGNGSTTAPALRMLGVPAAATSNFILAIDGSGNVTQTSFANGSFVVNGGQTGPLTVGTTNATSLNFITNNSPALLINNTGAVTVNSGLTVGNGETITAGGLTISSGGASITGATNVNTAGSLATNLGNASSTTTIVGPTNINITGGAVTNIGTGSNTGAVNIGNTTGNTSVNGSLAITPASGQTGLTVTGNSGSSTPTATFTAPGTGSSAATMSGNSGAPTLVLTGNGTTTAPALRMTGVPTAASSNFLLTIDGSGNVTETTITNGSFIFNGGQTGPLTIGTTNATPLTFITNNNPALSINTSGVVAVNSGLTVAGGETITSGGLTISAGGAAITGTTTINTTGAAATTLGNASSTTTITGPTNINTTGSAATQIGTGSTGPVSIGNTTGNTSVNGNLSLVPGTNQTALTVTGNGSATAITINTNTTTGSAATMVGNSSTPTLVLTGNGTTTAPALRMLGVPTAATSNFILAIDGSGNVTETTFANGAFIVNGGQSGPLTIGTTNATSLTLETNSNAALSINSTGNVTITPTSGTGLTIATGGETITAGGLTVAAGGAAITGTTNINTSGTATTTIGNSAGPSVNSIAGTTNINTAGTSTTTIGNVSSTTAITGPTNINTTGAATTNIGTSAGTGVVNIGNTTGNTAISGSVTITPSSTETGLTVNGNASNGLPSVNVTATGNGSAATMTGNASAPTLLLTGNTTTTAPALRMLGVPTAAGSNVILALDASGNVTQTTSTTGSIIFNGGQTGPLTIGTTNATPLTFITNSTPTLSISSGGAVNINAPTSGTGLTVAGGETITGTTNINTTGTAATNIGNASSTTTHLGPTNINITGNSATQIGNASSSTTLTGPVGINTGGSASTQIGAGGTGPVSIGNTTGNTSISGNLTIFPSAQIGLTIAGNGAFPAASLTSSATAPALLLAGQSTTTAPALRMTGVPAAASANFVLAIDNSGNVTQTAITDTTLGNIIVNGGQTGPLTIGTTNASIMTFETNSTAAMTINSSGQIGIGTEPTGLAPYTQLVVPGKIPTSFVGSTATSTTPSFVYVQGRYAYVTSLANTLQAFDVSNSATPIPLGSATTGTGPQAVYVQGKYAYVVSITSNLLQIFDVSNPASIPPAVGSLTLTGAGPVSIYVRDRYAYLNNNSSGALQIIDVSNPEAPVPVPGGSVTVGGAPFSVYVQGRYAYTLSQTTNILNIVDVSNPSAPALVAGGSIATGAHPSALYVQGRYVYVINRDSNSLQIVDVSTPSAPTTVATVPTGGGSGGPHAVYVQGRYAYVANQATATPASASVEVFDVSTPTAPISIGQISLSGSAPSSLYAQGRYLYVVSQTSNALQIFDVGGAYIQQLEAGGIEVGTLATRENMTVNNDFDVRGGATFAQGFNSTGPSSISTSGSFLASGSVAALTIIGNSAAASSTPLQLVGVPTSAGTDTVLTIDASGNVKETTTILSNFIINGGQTGPLTIGTTNATIMTFETNNIVGMTVSAGNIGIGSEPTGLAPYTQLVVPGNVATGPVGSATTGINPTGIYVQGKYAYVVNEGGAAGALGLQIFDVSTPSAPTLINTVGTTTTPNPYSISVQGRYAYICSIGGAFQVWDISNPFSPALTGSVTLGGVTQGLYVQGQYAYCAVNGVGLQAVNISNPAAPTLAGSAASGALPVEVFVQGRYAYVLSATGNEMQIFDVSSPATTIPAAVGFVSLGTGTSARGIYVQGRYAYVVTNSAANPPQFQIFDVSNPAAPTQVAGSALTLAVTVGGVYVQGRYAYITDETNNRIQIIDVSNPATPTVVGVIPTATGGNPFRLFVQGRYAYIVNTASTGASGLQVIDLGGAYIQQLEAGGIEVGTLQTRDNMTVNNDLIVAGGATFERGFESNGDSSVNGIATFFGTTSINITGAATTSIGNTTGASGIVEQVGTGNFSLDGAASSTFTFAPSITTGTITMGGTAQTGTTTLGSSSGTNTFNIANGTGATTLNLANTQTAGSVHIGGAMTTGTISLGNLAQTGTISTLAKVVANNVACINGQAVQTSAATTGTIITNATTAILILTGTGPNVTVDFPPNPTDGQLFTIMYTVTTNNNCVIASAGGTGGAAVASAITQLNATQTANATQNGVSVTYYYRSTGNTWFRYARG